MYNRKVLIDALKKLGSAKAPTQQKDMIIDPMGQWAHPGENTRIPSDRITMKGVNYPVLGIANTGQKQMMQPGQEYNFPGADYVDEYPQMRNGGLPNKKSSKKYSRSLDATNRLFAENPWFKKPKSRKNKIYDPNARYYQPGGEIEYNQLPKNYQDALKNFVAPEVINLPEETDTERYGYDAALGVIKQNPNDPIANMNNPWWREHELFHHLQNQAGAMSTYGTVGQRPNPYVASDEAIGSYYDRRGAEFDIELNKIFEQNPNISEEEAYALAEENLYRNPTSVEGEARNYEGYIEAGNPSMFPKKQQGGSSDLPQNVGITYLPEDGRSFYDPLSDTINLNPNATDAELNHEMVHAWQNRTGRLRTNPNLPQQRPPIVASDEQAASYYTRKADDVDYYLNNLSTLHPDVTGGNIWTEDLNRFIPDQMKYDKVIDPLMYLDPNTMEGEAEMFSQLYGPPPGISFRKKGGALSKFLDGGPQCPEGYTYNPETKRCEGQRTDCPEGYDWDEQEGRCKSKAYREKSELYIKGKKVVPTEEQEKYPWWPDDLTIKNLEPRYNLIQPEKRLSIFKPGLSDTTYEWSPLEVEIYPDLNYQVVVDPNKPKGYNADKSIYYVPDENNFEFEKFKQYKKLKEVEKENLANLAKYPNLTTKTESGYNWEDAYLNPEYTPFSNKNKTFDEYKNIKKEEYEGCTDCTYGHGETISYDDDDRITEQNLGHIYNKFYDIPDYDTRFEREHDYIELSNDSVIPKLDLASSDVEAPTYAEGDPDMMIPHVRLDAGKSRRVTKSGRLSGGQRYKHTEYKQGKDLEFGKHEVNRLIPALVQKFTGYDPKYYQGYDKEVGDETEYVPGEIERAEQEGRKINFKGAATLRDLKKQKEYDRQWLDYQNQKDEVRQQNEDYLKEYDITPEEYEQYYGPFRKGGVLPKAQFGFTGFGRDRALTATPFDFRTSYGQSTDFYKNPNYSLTYTTPNLFKMDVAANPLSFTIGSPYHTDKQRLTPPQLDMNPIYRQDYYDPAFQAASGPQYQQYLQDVSNYSGTPVSGLNQNILNQYNAAKNLAAVKPTYKKGIPLTANVEYGIYGNAGPFIGALNLGAGYAPEPGFYGTMDASAYGVFGKRKHNKEISRKTYFDNGLTRQGDRVWIPRLNIFNTIVKQHPDYNDAQTQKVLELYNEDIQQGTTKAEDFLYNGYDQTSEMPFGFSALSPELTFQVKPFKDIPGVLSLTAGLRNTLGGKDKAETTVGGQWTSRPYGNIRYSIPLEGAIDKLKDLDLPTIKRKKTYNDYADDQEYDEEYTDDTPQEDTPTENNIEVNPPELQVNPNGTVLGRGDCPEGYERPCPKCRCQKIKMPQMYTDKRGTRLFGNEPIRFQSGGEQEAMNAMMKARLAYANMFGNPAAQRMINIPDQPYEFDNGDMGTHYMASMDNYAVPQIQDENGQLMLGNYGPESKEAIRFDSDEDANYFAENYKDVSPGFIDLELTEDQIEEYKKGGYIIEDISVPSLTKMQGGGDKLIKGLTQPTKIIRDINTIGKELLGELLQGPSNRKAIAAGNNWLDNWISHPVTQAKIEADVLNAPFNTKVNPNYFSTYSTPVYGDRAITDYDKYIYALQLAKDFKSGVTEYPILSQIDDLINDFGTEEEQIHSNSLGFTTLHQEDPFQRELYKSGYYKPNSTVIDRDYKPYKNFGSFVSRKPSISQDKRKSITVHEGTHDWITDWLLKNTGQFDLIQSLVTPEYLDYYNRWKAKDKTLTDSEKKKGYYADPTEVHARIMQIRELNDLTPFDTIDDSNSGYFMDQLLRGDVPFNGSNFAEMLGNDRSKLAKLMNELYGIALPIGVAAGAGSLLANPYTDESPIGKYQGGGEYELGDEIDEATMKQLKKLGYTFEKI